MEGCAKEEIVTEWKVKVLPTYLVATVVWIPLQIANFKFILPQYRVAVVAILTLLEVNVLCIVKRYSSQNLIEQFKTVGIKYPEPNKYHVKGPQEEHGITNNKPHNGKRDDTDKNNSYKDEGT